MNVKVSNLTSGVNEKKELFQHDCDDCKCELNESVFSSKQKWNNDECRCKCTELND